MYPLVLISDDTWIDPAEVVAVLPCRRDDDKLRARVVMRSGAAAVVDVAPRTAIDMLGRGIGS